MKELGVIIFFLLISHTSCFSQVTKCECELKPRERKLEIYKGFHCLTGFIRANLKDKSLSKYVGQVSTYEKFEQISCDNSHAEFIDKDKTTKVTIHDGEFLLDEHTWDYDPDGIELGDTIIYLPIGISGKDVLGIKTGIDPYFINKQRLVSFVKIETEHNEVIVPIEDQILIFDPNFCEAQKWIQQIEVYDIGKGEIAIYIHGIDAEGGSNHTKYIAKIIIDVESGYVGTLFIEDYVMRAYGWSSRCNLFKAI